MTTSFICLTFTQKDDKKTKKVGRRLSSRVTDLFKSKPKPETASTPKVEEAPPQLEEPEPTAPLENPAVESAPVTETKPEEAPATTEEVKPTEPAAEATVAAAT
jgi:hypothetical protein